MSLYKKILLFILVVLFGAVGYFAFMYFDKSTKTIPAPDIKPVEEQVSQEELSQYNTYKFKYTYNLDITGKIDILNLKILFPQDEIEHQYITINSVSLKPDKYDKTPEALFGEYLFKNITKSQTIVIDGIAKVRTYDYNVAKMLNKNISPEKDLTPYLQAEKYIESDDPYIKNIAQKIQGNTKEEIMQNIYEYLQKNIKYTYIEEDIGAKKALQKKQGKCSEYAVAMVALCRAKNIPARIVSGDMFNTNKTAHSWVEVYYDEYGWVTYDPTFQGIHVSEPLDNGKVKKYVIYDAKDTNSDYIILNKNHINYLAFKFTSDDYKANRISFSKNLEYEKVD